MKHEIAEMNKFDACVKKTLVNELKYRLRSMKNDRERYVNISELSQKDINQLSYADTYPSDIFSEKLTTRLFDTVIHDELLYEALMSIKPNIRELIVLEYWGNLTDAEVGQVISMSRRMVNYNKNNALQKLRKIIEELRNR